MKPIMKPFFLAILVVTSVLLVGCNLRRTTSGSNPGSGSGTGPFTIGGVVTGLASGSTGLVIQDNATDNLTISGNGTFTFKTAIVSGKGYNVSISTPPTSPSQTCTVANPAGTAAANVTNVQITCSTGTLSIGGTVVGLLGTGLVLQNNGGDDLAIATSNPFTFKTAVAIGSKYSVTVSTQPASPTQTCTVTNGTGTANTNVGNIQITCSTGTISIGGTVTGLAQAGSGIILQNNGIDSLTVRANGSFTMPTLVSAGSTYTITILTQPSGPNQTCTVTSGKGTANANVTNVQIVCPAIFHTIGGTVVGLVGATSKLVLQNKLGDNLTVTSNGAFTFNTPIADGSTYDVSLLSWNPDSQPGVGVVLWGYQGTATSAVTSVIVDCGHNDWSWFDGVSTANANGTFTTPTPAPPTFDADSPGGRKYPATWTDFNGNLWLFGGFGLTFTPGLTPPATELNDMWEYTGTQNYFGSYNNIWINLIPAFTAGPAPRTGAVTWTQPGAGGDLFLFGGEDGGGTFYNDVWRYHIVPGSAGTWTHVSGGANLNGAYGTQNVPSINNFPGSRWGATGRIDGSGKVWLFGGYGYDSASATPGLLNDLWNYDISTGQWTWVSGSKTANQSGNYGTLNVPLGTNIPGARADFHVLD